MRYTVMILVIVAMACAVAAPGELDIGESEPEDGLGYAGPRPGYDSDGFARLGQVERDAGQGAGASEAAEAGELGDASAPDASAPEDAEVDAAVEIEQDAAVEDAAEDPVPPPCPFGPDDDDVNGYPDACERLLWTGTVNHDLDGVYPFPDDALAFIYLAGYAPGCGNIEAGTTAPGVAPRTTAASIPNAHIVDVRVDPEAQHFADCVFSTKINATILSELGLPDSDETQPLPFTNYAAAGPVSDPSALQPFYGKRVLYLERVIGIYTKAGGSVRLAGHISAYGY